MPFLSFHERNHAFVTPLGVTVASRHARYTHTPVCTRPNHISPIFSKSPSSGRAANILVCKSGDHNTPQEHLADSNPWGVTDWVKMSAVTMAMFAGMIGGAGVGNAKAATKASVSVNNSVVRDGSGGDVEAAAMTLGAVTVGGLVMRVIVSTGRDEKKEKERLEKECKRLEEEEKERMMRADRRELESVSAEEEDGGLMEELRKRVEGLGGEEEADVADVGAGEEERWGGTGLGSAVLERKESESENGEGEGVGEDPVASPDDVEMLRRMWQISEEGDEGKKDGRAGKSS